MMADSSLVLSPIDEEAPFFVFSFSKIGLFLFKSYFRKKVALV